MLKWLNGSNRYAGESPLQKGKFEIANYQLRCYNMGVAVNSLGAAR